VVDCPAVPITLNCKISSVPAPDIAPPWNAEMIRCPGLAALGVIDMVLLNVPACIKAGEAGTITAALKSTFRSYEMIF
jgi:hypothetical protein